MPVEVLGDLHRSVPVRAPFRESAWRLAVLTALLLVSGCLGSPPAGDPATHRTAASPSEAPPADTVGTEAVPMALDSMSALELGIRSLVGRPGVRIPYDVTDFARTSRGVLLYLQAEPLPNGVIYNASGLVWLPFGGRAHVLQRDSSAAADRR